MTKPRLLIVDDDPEMADLVENIGGISGFETCSVGSARAFQDAWARTPPSVIVMDLVMPNMDGIELLKWLAHQQSSAPIILISGFERRYLDIAKSIGTSIGENVVGTLTKPFHIEDLVTLLNAAISTSSKKAEKG